MGRANKYEVWDEKVKPLCIRVLPNGTKTFFYVYSFCSRTRWYRIGPLTIGIKEARRQAVQLIARVARDEDPQAKRMAERGAGTFAELHQRYLEEWAKRHNKSWQQADRLIRVYVLKKWAKLSANHISRADVRQLFNSLSETPNQANKVKDAVSAVFTWAAKQDVVTTNPCKGIDNNPTGSRDRILSDSEVPVFWRACDEVDPVKSRALKTVLLTGARPGEVAHMRYEHIRDGGWWTMPGQPLPELGWPGVKNASTHRIWLTAKVIELIGDVDARSGFVFVNERNNAIDDLDAAMREISRRLDPPAVWAHDLRRTFGSKVTGRGHGREAMDRILNHRKRSVTDTYDRHDYAERDRRIMEDVTKAFMELIEGRPADNVIAANFRT
jgi:integrase